MTAIGGGLTLPDVRIAINNWLLAHGWGVRGQGGITVSGDDAAITYISITLLVDCYLDADATSYQLGETVAGAVTTGLFGGSPIFTYVSLDPTGIGSGCEAPYQPPVIQPNGGGGGNMGGSTYTVVYGDTLSAIAARYGLTLAQLLALNPQITNPNQINVGQVINVSGTPHVTVITQVNPLQTQHLPVGGSDGCPSGTRDVGGWCFPLLGGVPVPNPNSSHGTDPTGNGFSDTVNDFAKGIGLSVAALGMLAILAIAVVKGRD